MSVAALVGFQPTLSVWRETGHGVTSFLRGWHFNPLSPCGERHRLEVFRELSGEFQPTLSVWRETERIARRLHKLVISTHSLRVERDKARTPCRYARRYFNPLSPCGERRVVVRGAEHSVHISTHSLRVERDRRGRLYRHGSGISTHSLRVERDYSPRFFSRYIVISTHSLRVERDVSASSPLVSVSKFQPTLSVWRETVFSAHGFHLP